jgi:hypothetical protein
LWEKGSLGGGGLAAAQLAKDSCGLVHGAGNEGGIFPVSGVVVAPVEDAEGLVGNGREGLVEADEAYFVVDLEFKVSN